MKGMIKKATAWLAVTALVLAMVGCGTAETSQPTEGTETDMEAAESNASEPESEEAEETAGAKGDETKSETADVEKDDEHEKAADAVQNMLIGWNLGNTFDATGDWIPKSAGGAVEKFETAWGNPVTPSSLMPKLKSLGFGAVRIPITWNYHFDEEGNIDAEWMARIKEVVDWAMEADLYCIINIHHDTGADGWLRSSKANYEKNNVIFAKLWEQIATEFKDYPDTLVFEVFSRLAKRFTDQNMPLIIGEFATDDKGNTEDRIKWYTHVIEKANELNAPCFLWDNGNGFNMGHIDRVGNDDAFPQIIEACVETAE